jgi:hypothetical protein
MKKERLKEIIGDLVNELEDMYDRYLDNDDFGDYITDLLTKEEAEELDLDDWFGEDDDDEEELTDEDYEEQFGSEMAIRICRANGIPLSDIEKYGSDAYWINDGINNLQDLYDINEDFVLPTGDEELIRDYRVEILEEDE